MHRPARITLVLILALALILPTTAADLSDAAVEQTPTVHVVADTSAHRADANRAIAWALTFQKPDGGVYEFEFFQKESNSARALRALARDQRQDVRGPALSGLIRFFEETQNADGSWGTRSRAPAITVIVLDGLAFAGYDANSTMVQRARLYIQATQNLDGSWSDGFLVSSFQTARSMRALLLTGTPRDSENVQRALTYILEQQDPTTGGFRANQSFGPSPQATATVLEGLDAYLRTPATGAEVHADVDVETAAEWGLAFIGETFNWTTMRWNFSVSTNTRIVGPVASYLKERGRQMPEWMPAAVEKILDHQAESGAILNDPKETEMLDWTLFAARSLLEIPGKILPHHTLPVRSTLNLHGEYLDATVTLTVLNAAGEVMATSTGPDGLGSITWLSPSKGRYTLRAEAEDAPAAEMTLWRTAPPLYPSP